MGRSSSSKMSSNPLTNFLLRTHSFQSMAVVVYDQSPHIRRAGHYSPATCWERDSRGETTGCQRGGRAAKRHHEHGQIVCYQICIFCVPHCSFSVRCLGALAGGYVRGALWLLCRSRCFPYASDQRWVALGRMVQDHHRNSRRAIRYIRRNKYVIAHLSTRCAQTNTAIFIG